MRNARNCPFLIWHATREFSPESDGFACPPPWNPADEQSGGSLVKQLLQGDTCSTAVENGTNTPEYSLSGISGKHDSAELSAVSKSGTTQESTPPEEVIYDTRPWALRVGRPQDVYHGRTRHPNEAPYTSIKDAGQIIFEFRPDPNENKGLRGLLGILTGKSAKAPNRFVDAKGDRMKLFDLYEHMIVFGGSGTGKTYSVLQPLWEEWFRATHIPDVGRFPVHIKPGAPPIHYTRNELKFGALVIEAKGDFRDKTWRLAQKYGRMDDCIFFGPTHPDVTYDMFGDPTESAMQKANKMLAIMKAFSDGRSGQDPFWDNAARKLFTNIFILHEMLERASRDAETPEEKEAFEVSKMSFGLLNILLMDRGQPKNQAEVNACHDTYRQYWGEYIEASREMARYISLLEMDAEIIERIRQDANNMIVQDTKAIEAMFDKLHDPNSGVTMETINPLRHALITKRARLRGLDVLLDGYRKGEDGTFAERCVELRKNIAAMFNCDDDYARAQYSNKSAEAANLMAAAMREAATALDRHASNEIAEIRATMLGFIDATDRALIAREKVARIQMVQPEYGMLRRMLAKYETLLGKAGKEPQADDIWAYFNEEYLNVANDKTAGSVAMVASNLVMMFVHPPFSNIFKAGGTFTFNNAINDGKIVYLDMPTALYGKVATCASLVMKIDFFRAMLSRPRLRVRTPDGRLGKEIVNQTRPMVYFCDEFASIVSTGDETGEAGFMDKVREFQCSCLLGVQSIPMLLKKMDESEVDAILTNTAIKVFLRNTDAKTNKLASELMGTEIKVTGTMRQSAVQAFFDTSKQVGQRIFDTSQNKSAKYDVGDFAKLDKGEAIVCINPRFKKNQIQRVRFMGKAIDNVDTENLYPVPCVDPE